MEENREQRVRSKFLIGTGIVVAAILVISVILLSTKVIGDARYNSAVTAGNAYYNAGDYASAALEYQNAIKIDRKKESAYLNLSSVYIAVGDYQSAEIILSQGLGFTASDTMQERYQQVLLYQQKGIGTEEKRTATTEEEIAEASASVVMEDSVFDMVASYGYSEYLRDFGEPSGKELASRQVRLSYASQGMTAIYYNLQGEIVLNAAGNMPIERAKPIEVSFHNVRKLFGGTEEVFAVSFEKLQELMGQGIKIKQEDDGRFYISGEYKGCILKIETDSQGNIIDEQAENTMSPIDRSVFEESANADGQISGYVQDATTGRGMKATLKFRENGKKNGEVIKEVVSDSKGKYNYEGMKGTYTVEVSAKGYITEYVELKIVKGEAKTRENIILTPEVGEGEIIIVLSWDSAPSDLDGHVEGRTSSGNRFHIGYDNPGVSGVGNLDVDDRNGYGPETITILDAGASFEYFVVDFREEGTMHLSDATVKVYLPGSRSAEVFHVPSDSGMVWRVFEYEAGELRTINRMN